MKLIKKLSFLSSGVFVRLICGSLIVFILARMLGPEDYGELVIYISISSLIIVISDLGYQTYLVKEASGDKKKVSHIVTDSLIIKTLSLPLYLFIVYVAFSIYSEKLNYIEIIWVSLSIYFLSLGDFLNVTFRIIEKYNVETNNICTGAVINLTLVSLSAVLMRDVESIALAMLISRLLYICLSINSYMNHFSFHFDTHSIRRAFSESQKILPFALDTGNVTFRNQIDIILLGFLTSTYYVGLYQAGLVLIRSLEKLAVIISNVFLVDLVSLKDNLECYKATAKKMLAILVSFGVVLFFIIYSLDVYIVKILFGEKFKGLEDIMSYLAIYLLLRYFASGLGTILTAAGMQRARVVIGIASTALLLFFLIILVPSYNVVGAIISQIIVVVCIIFSFLYFVVRKGGVR